MRYYLDVNALNIPNIFNSDKNLYFSAWGVFELLAGIKNDKEFRIRKSILKKLKNSNIKIIPHFQSSLCAEVFAFEDWNKNDDVKATLKMYELILNCASYDDYKKISFFFSDNTKLYDHELFQKFDELYSYDHTILLTDLIKKSNIQKQESGQKHKEYVPITHLCLCDQFKKQNRIYACNFAKLHLKDAIQEGYYLDELFKRINENKIFKHIDETKKQTLNNQINNKKYSSEIVELLQTYDGVQTIIDSILAEKLNQSMVAFDKYTANIRDFNFPTICEDTSIKSILNSQHPARNDSQDLGHLYFIDHVDFFVSNDHFFHRTECLKEKVINLKEFINNHL